jgi:hypothetical protein
MRLPTPVYERVPQIWFLMGLLFIANGLYIGIDFPFSLACIAVGFICCAFGACIAIVRMKHRRSRSTDGGSPVIAE